MTNLLAQLLEDSAYRLDQFEPVHIAALEAAITVKTAGKTATPYLACLVRGKPITRLLDAAKRAVEIAIEDSEAAGLAFLESVA